MGWWDKAAPHFTDNASLFFLCSTAPSRLTPVLLQSAIIGSRSGWAWTEQSVCPHKQHSCRRWYSPPPAKHPLPTWHRSRCPEQDVSICLLVVLLRRILHASAPGMDPESGAASAGSFISLNEHEQRYYSGLHGLCQADTSGKLSSGKVAELFKASQLPPESLHKVSTAHLRLLGHHMLSSARGWELRLLITRPQWSAGDTETIRLWSPVYHNEPWYWLCGVSSWWCVYVCVREVSHTSFLFPLCHTGWQSPSLLH